MSKVTLRSQWGGYTATTQRGTWTIFKRWPYMTNTASVRPTGYDAYLNLTTKLRITRDSQWEEHHHARTLAEIRRLIADPQ